MIYLHLSFNRKLNRAAYEQSTYLSSFGDLTHIGRGGSSSHQRILATGFRAASTAENLAGTTDVNTAFGLLHNSPKHLKNMLGNYQFIGIAEGRTNRRAWAQTFATQAGGANEKCMNTAEQKLPPISSSKPKPTPDKVVANTEPKNDAAHGKQMKAQSVEDKEDEKKDEKKQVKMDKKMMVAEAGTVCTRSKTTTTKKCTKTTTPASTCTKTIATPTVVKCRIRKQKKTCNKTGGTTTIQQEEQQTEQVTVYTTPADYGSPPDYNDEFHTDITQTTPSSSRCSRQTTTTKSVCTRSKTVPADATTTDSYGGAPTTTKSVCSRNH